MTADLSVVFLAGILGSSHCVGMCGGFVLTLSGTRSERTLLIHQSAYFVGKTLTYAVLGMAVGLVGQTVTGSFAGVQQTISILAGAVMIGIGLGLTGVIRMAGTRAGVDIPLIRQGMQYFMQHQSMVGTLGLGLLNGLLPCGLVYAILAKAAATGSLLGGGLTMAAFGLGTIPALFVLGWIGHLISGQMRTRLHQFSGIVVLVLGAITIVRGLPA